MLKTIQTLEQRVEADVFAEKTSGTAVAFWKELDTQRRLWARILAHTNASITDDGDLLWTPAFIQEFESIQRTFWQRLSGAEIEGAMYGPDKGEYRATGPRRDVVLLWSADERQNVQALMQKRKELQSGKKLILGGSIAAFEGPQPTRRTLLLNQQYGPETERFVDDGETRRAFHEGMDYILGQVLPTPEPHEHASAPLLRNLKAFRANNAHWATLQGEGIISLEPGKINDAWMIVVPPTNEIATKQKHTILVKREQPSGVLVMRVLPFAFTREWAGLVGVHELEHLENAYTGKEPECPSKDEYIDGEIRAFTVEIGAANILSRGKFGQGIDTMIDTFGWKSTEDIRRMLGTPMILILANNLDPHVTVAAPKSRAEKSLRLGLYSMATAFRIAEREASCAEEALQIKKEFIGLMYGKAGVI